MYLLNIALLYACAGSVLALLFQYVNLAFPDSLSPSYDSGGAIRWAIASLVIIFPVFVWGSWFLRRDMTREPEKAELKIRRWLLYLTLFAAAVLIIGDLVALLYNFLEGDLTISFFLKILAVFAVAAAVFGYYLYELRRDPQKFSVGARVFAWGVVVVIAGIVIAGFFAAGSPFTQRAIRFDRERVNNLQDIQSRLVLVWQQKGSLPRSLNELTDAISGFAAPRDPETNTAYEYKKTGDLAFELCATFAFSSDADRLAPMAAPVGLYSKPDTMNNWKHGAGVACFERAIDPELYKTDGKSAPTPR